LLFEAGVSEIVLLMRQTHRINESEIILNLENVVNMDHIGGVVITLEQAQLSWCLL
jgi:hypothetical protein